MNGRTSATTPSHPSRAVARAARGMVVTPHPLATLAGVDVLRRGGNAVDAAIAANAVLAVVYPASCGLGGDAFWLVYDPASGEVVGYNGSGRSPAAAELGDIAATGARAMPERGALPVTVPGAVRSWEEVGAAHGRRALDELLEPAERYAREGCIVTDVAAQYFARGAPLLRADPEAARTFLARGVPRAGERLRQPDLAATLAAIRRGGADAFYTGATAERIVATLRAGGSRMTLDDLAAHRTERTRPLRIAWHDRTVYAHPPNSQGATTLMALGMLGSEGASDEPAWTHLAIEALKYTLVERNATFADPAFFDSGVEAKLEPRTLAAMRSALDPIRSRPLPTPVDHGDTIAICAVDEFGGAVSLIESLYLGFGSGIVARDTGVVLHDRGAGFSLEAGHPNAFAGRKRPMHTLSPGMLLRDGEPELVFGTMGGNGQPQIHVQLLHGIYERGWSVQAALDAPRWIVGRHAIAERPEIVGGDAVIAESRLDADVVAYLRARGHAVHVLDAYGHEMGHAHAIAVDAEHGTLAGGADPRADSLALGY